MGALAVVSMNVVDSVMYARVFHLSQVKLTRELHRDGLALIDRGKACFF